MGRNNRLTITEVAKSVGVTPRTIMRWEKAGKIKRSRRDWRGWRFYHKEDLEEIKNFYESAYEYDENGRTALDLVKDMSIIILILSASLVIGSCDRAYAETNFARTAKAKGITETPTSIDINLNALPVVETPGSAIGVGDPVKYTLGPNDIISVEARRHPEFSGKYTINSEGKIEYKFVGDIPVTGLTKLQLKEKLTKILSEFLIEPEVDVTIVAYLSKVIYVVGEVSRPGKFYMKGNTITVREALIQSGLPTYSAAMRKCRLITPNNTGKDNYVEVNVYKLIYEGDLAHNLEMKPGDVLYVPATAIAKIIRVISPVTNVTGQAAGAAARGAALGL